MSLSECLLEPETCPYSEYFEWQKRGHEKILRWIECTDYLSATRVEMHNGVSGNLCLKNPVDWVESNLEALK